MTLNLPLNIVSGTAPFDYSIMLDDSCDCAILEGVTGTFDATGEYTIPVTLNDCYTDCVLTIFVTDAQGCVAEKIYDFNELCATLDVVAINQLDNTTYQAIVTGGTPPYTYEWFLPSTMQTLDNTTNPLNVNIVEDFESSPLAVKVTDSFGCFTVHNVNVQLCRPTMEMLTPNVVIGSGCNAGVRIELMPCANSTVSINDVEIVVPAGFTATPEALNNNILSINVDASNASPVNLPYQFDVKVTDSDGVSSIVYNFFVFHTIECPTDRGDGPIPDTRCGCEIRTECVPVVQTGDKLMQLITDCVPEICDDSGRGGDLDRDSFQLIAGPFLDGATVTYDPATHQLIYTVGTETTGVDTIDFMICNNQGQCTGTVRWYINLNCIPEPTLADVDVCTVCGMSTEIDVLAGDTNMPPLDASTLVIITPPNLGSALVSNGLIVYTPPFNSSGTTSLEFGVCDNNGNCITATLNIEVTCAGADGSAILCI